MDNFVDKLLDRAMIRKLGDLLNLDAKYYIKNFSYLAFTAVVSTGLGVMLSIAFARLLSKEIFGQYNYILSIIGVVAILAMSGMGPAITQAVSRGYDKTLIAGVKEKLRWSTLGSLSLIVISIYYFLNGSLLLGKCFIISALIFPFFENFKVYIAYLTGKQEFGKLAKYQLIVQITAVFLTFLVIYFTRDLILILLTYLASNSIVRVYIFSLTTKTMHKHNSDPEAISFGRHMTILHIPDTIRQHFDKLFIGIFLSFPELAIYSIALGFSNILNPFRMIVARLIFPKLSQLDKERAYAEVKQRWPFLILGFGIIAVILTLLCPYIIPFLYSQRYFDSVFYAQILMISMIFAAPIPTFNKALFASQKEINKLYRVITVSALTEILLLSVLVLTLGLLGAALAKLLARIFTLLYEWKLIS